MEKQGELAQPYNEAFNALRHAGLQPRQKVGRIKPGQPNAAEEDRMGSYIPPTPEAAPEAAPKNTKVRKPRVDTVRASSYPANL